jgi:predicted nucleic acid-binding protein
VEPASLGGVVLDSTVLIAAERRGHSVREILEQVQASQGDVEVGISVVSIAELVHGAYRARDAARQERRLQFIERLTFPCIPCRLTSPDSPAASKGSRKRRESRCRSGICLSARPRSISITESQR